MTDAEKASLAAQVREFCKHPVYAHLQAFINDKLNDTKHEWARIEDRAKAEEIRLKAKAYLDIETFLKRLLIEGDAAFNRIQGESHEV